MKFFLIRFPGFFFEIWIHYSSVGILILPVLNRYNTLRIFINEFVLINLRSLDRVGTEEHVFLVHESYNAASHDSAEHLKLAIQLLLVISWAVEENHKRYEEEEHGDIRIFRPDIDENIRFV